MHTRARPHSSVLERPFHTSAGESHLLFHSLSKVTHGRGSQGLREVSCRPCPSFTSPAPRPLWERGPGVAVSGLDGHPACPVQAQVFGRPSSTSVRSSELVAELKRTSWGPRPLKALSGPDWAPKELTQRSWALALPRSPVSIASPLPAAQGAEPAPEGPVLHQGQSSGLCPLPGGPTDRMSLLANVCHSVYGRFWGVLPWTPPW